MELFFQLLFYASAIFYNIDDLGGIAGKLVNLNPLALLIDAARKAFVFGEITHVKAVLAILAVTTVMFFLGRKFFNNNIRKIAEYF